MKPTHHKQEEWEKEAKRLFLPYAAEFDFGPADWRVFLARIQALIELERSLLLTQAKVRIEKLLPTKTNTAFLSAKTVKNNDIGLAYKDGLD